MKAGELSITYPLSFWGGCGEGGTSAEQGDLVNSKEACLSEPIKGFDWGNYFIDAIIPVLII
jgi:hypothetical protein